MHTDQDVDSKVVLEERIEEVTTSTTFSDLEELDATDDNDAFDSSRTTNKAVRVAFPEFGVDLVEASVYCFDTDSFFDDKSVRITDLLSWEENWLFQKKRKSDSDVVPQYCFSALDAALNPNMMLIPNPSQASSAKVGAKEVDELSDLSEHNSGSSLIFSEEDDGDNISFKDVQRVYCDEVIAPEVDVSNRSVNSQLSKNESVEVREVKEVKEAKEVKEVKTKSQRDRKGSATTEAICVEVVPKSVPIPHFVPSQQRQPEVIEDPCFVFPPGSASVQNGILIQFCCRVKGSSPVNVAWFKCDHCLVNDENYRIIRNGNDHILEIKHTKSSLAGNYSCVVFNHLNQKWTDFTLDVKTYQRPRKEKAVLRTYQQTGEKEALPKQRSPTTVIQRTWDQRRAEENSERRQAEFALESGEIQPPPLPDDTVGTLILPTTSIAEREHRKWEECAVKWPNNPYTKESIEKRKLLRAVSLDSVLDDCSLSDDCEKMPNISPSKDLSRYKRDYFVPVVEKDEALNCFEEKIYSGAKYFSLNNSPSPQCDVCVCSDRLSDRGYVAEQETILSSVSVKDLVDRFSENSDNKSASKLRRRSTFSCSNISKATANGVKANLTHINTNYKVHSLTARNLTKFRDKCKAEDQDSNVIQRSKSLMNVNNGRESSSNSSETCSPTNEGYNSDESNSSGVLRKTPQVTTVKLKAPKKISRSILKRASYWEKRCEQGLLSDSSVNEDFPAMETNSYLK